MIASSSQFSGGDQAADSWMEAPVSSRSRFGDDLWYLDIHVAGRRPDENRLVWRVQLPDGSYLTAPQHAAMLRAAKQYLWSMAVDPPQGRKRLSSVSLRAHGVLLLVIMRWMSLEGLTAFQMLDPAAVKRLCAWLRERPSRTAGGTLRPSSLILYLNVINTMFCQRAKLTDSPLIDPLIGETTGDAAGMNQATQGSIPFIPDVLAIDVLSKALTWVENYSANILTAFEERTVVAATARAAGRNSKVACKIAARAMRRSAITGPDGLPLIGGYVINGVAAHLGTACFVLIAGFVGMRVSEILSIKVGGIEYHPLGEAGIKQAYIVGRLFKMSDDPRGRIERWLAPVPVVRAVECLERLSMPLRTASGRLELFLAKNRQYGTIVPTTSMDMNHRLRLFAKHVHVPHEGDKAWHFTAHQFRKTFARFIARRDRSQLLGLADHFKHVSRAMTSRGYVGTDFGLHELVDQEGRVETALALDGFLASDRLGGRMGERIAARNEAFRGRAGEQVRRDYVAFVLAETDLRIHACDYGWCVFQPETARCGGEAAPSEAGRSPAVCLDCVNFVVDDRHIRYWEDRRGRNLALRVDASPLVRAVLDEVIEQCDRVLGQIKER